MTSERLSFDPRRFAALAHLQLKARYLVEGLMSGLHQSPYRGFSVEFSEYRDYQPGDDLRHLDWRLYARNDRLCIREFEEETNVRVYLVLDGSGSMAYRGAQAWAAKWECAQVMASALGWMLLRQRDAVGALLVAGGEVRHIPPSQKRSQLGTLLREFDAAKAAGDRGLAQALERASALFHRRSLVAIFTDFLDPAAELAARVRELRFSGHDCFVFQILDADEIDFPFSEDAVFEDLETGALRQVVPARARRRYLERFAAFMEPHRRLLRDLEIPHEVIRTDADPGRALSRFIANRRRRP